MPESAPNLQNVVSIKTRLKSLSYATKPGNYPKYRHCGEKSLPLMKSDEEFSRKPAARILNLEICAYRILKSCWCVCVCGGGGGSL